MGNSATDKYSCKVARAKPSSAAEIGANTCPQKSSGRVRCDAEDVNDFLCVLSLF